MPWRQLTSLLRDRLAPSLQGRVALHQARYRHAREEVGRVWLQVDGREVVQFDTSTYLQRRAAMIDEARAAGSAVTDDEVDERLRRAGLYGDQGALADLHAYLSLSIEDALASPSPLVRALAVVDRRVGRRRLVAAPVDGHPAVRELLRLRREAEGIEVDGPGA